uniref:Chemokine interleukin-8-like domain-containing protein n=1 Tax=Stegastes partitus TaxID=144197 RepID=A0A3B5BC16_9TELE
MLTKNKSVPVSCFPAVALHRCRCLRTVSHRVPARVVKKIEVTPASGHCRLTEATCLFYATFSILLQFQKNATFNSTASPPTSSATDF